MTAGVLPTSIVHGGDQQTISVYAGNQSATYVYHGTAPSFALPPPLTGITFGADNTSASWSSLPSPNSGVSLFAYSLDTAGGFEDLEASKGWLDAHQATSIAMPTDVPGWQPSWTLASAMYADVEAWHDDGDYTYYSSATAMTAPTPRLAAPTVARARQFLQSMR